MSLDLKPLEDAVAQLEGTLAAYGRPPVRDDPELQKYMRAAAIQAFEFTYEVTFKMIKRHLEKTMGDPSEFHKMTFDSIMREAFAQGLVCSEISVWRKYRKNVCGQVPLQVMPEFAQIWARTGVDSGGPDRIRKNRGITSHTYNENKAQEIFGGVMDFLQDARYALIQLQERNGS